MQTPGLPANEAERLTALESYGILDSEPDSAYDELTRLASKICATPIALISLVDASRQWFKSRVGLDATQTARDLAFCAHAISDPTTLVVPDASQDARFHDNPLVTGPPEIRFYAGAPLHNGDGYALGTLCVIDRAPRALRDEQLADLETLSRQAMNLMELQRSNRLLQQQLEHQRELSQLRSICSHCHSVRSEAGRWQPIAPFLRDIAGMQFSHGLCPACLVQHYS